VGDLVITYNFRLGHVSHDEIWSPDDKMLGQN
jgi:hypothetical protein